MVAAGEVNLTLINVVLTKYCS